MKRALVALCVTLASSSASAAIALVPGTLASTTFSGAANPSISLPASTTAGNDVFVVVSRLSGTAISSVTDSGGSTYTLIATKTNGYDIDLWAARNAVASTSVTAHFAGGVGTAGEMAALEYSGVAAYGASATSSGNSINPSVSITTQDNDNFVVAGLFEATTGGATVSSGTLETHNNDATTGKEMDTVQNTSATPASVTCSVSISVGVAWGAVAVELRSSIPPTAPPTVTSMGTTPARLKPRGRLQ